MTTDEKLNTYFAMREAIFKDFGYIEDWRVLPLDDSREMFWKLDGTGPGEVTFAESIEALEEEDDERTYSNLIYTNCHLSKWVYEGKELTMICVDTQTDGNQFLQIFRNKNRVQ